ncbi:hypothetical protein cypCar_00018237 [Cyprinus carpio]|nr:hypothetical protein cypCar_00018237 [Cyprinus carpio]
MECLTELEKYKKKDVKDCSIKVENLPKQVIFKGLAPRVILTNHLLPKGTKAKVNLEEQGRQKISFSFAQTKKPRQNVFLAPPSPEKSASEHSSALQAGPVPTPDLAGQSDETKNVDTDTPAEVGETQAAPAPVSFPLKSKPVLGKIHFKKQILSVTVVEDNSIVTTTSAEISEPAVPSESDKIRSSAKIETETSLQQPHKNSVIDSSSEKVLKEENPQEKVDSCLKGPVSSHIGKGDKDTSVISEHEENRKSQSRSDTTLPGSESDGDSIRTSSSQKSSDRRNKIKSECPKTEEGPKVGQGLDLEAVEIVPIPGLKDPGVRDSQGQIGHITMILSGGFIEVLLIVKGEAHVHEPMAGLVTALTQKMTTGGQGLEVVTQVDPPLTLARKKTQNQPLTPDPTGTQNPQIVLDHLKQTKEHSIQSQNDLI